MNYDVITVVSGLPRSGTSMMMKMLEAGGLPVLTDHERQADADNPKGYYEFEQVKEIETDKTWLPQAQGKVVKMISALLRHLPSDHRYKVIFMRRHMEEILASQRQMLVRRGEDTERVSDERMSGMFRHHLEQVEAWLEEQPNIDVLYVHYSAVLADPGPQAERVNEFFDGALDAQAMARVVDSSLYRQRT
jgi:DNA-binding transcriptional MerR regulator